MLSQLLGINPLVFDHCASVSCRDASALSQTLCWRLLGMCVVLDGWVVRWLGGSLVGWRTSGVGGLLGVSFRFWGGLGVPEGCNNNDDDNDSDGADADADADDDDARQKLTICAGRRGRGRQSSHRPFASPSSSPQKYPPPTTFHLSPTSRVSLSHTLLQKSSAAPFSLPPPSTLSSSSSSFSWQFSIILFAFCKHFYKLFLPLP